MARLSTLIVNGIEWGFWNVRVIVDGWINPGAGGLGPSLQILNGSVTSDPQGPSLPREPVRINWRVRNFGSLASEHQSWWDRITLKHADGTIESKVDVLHVGPLDHNGEYEATGVVYPQSNGSYTACVVPNHSSNVGPAGREVCVQLSVDGPDLEITNLVVIVGSTPQSGSTIRARWRVRNNGTEITSDSAWTDRFSVTDGTTNVHTEQVPHTGPLAAASTQSDADEYVGEGAVMIQSAGSYDFCVQPAASTAAGTVGTPGEEVCQTVELSSDPVPPSPCVAGTPRLELPTPDALLPNGERPPGVDPFRWQFMWGACPDAIRYELWVHQENNAPDTPNLLVRQTGTSYIHEDAYVNDSYINGWTWKARAAYNDGSGGVTWGDWSGEREFSVRCSRPVQPGCTN